MKPTITVLTLEDSLRREIAQLRSEIQALRTRKRLLEEQFEKQIEDTRRCHAFTRHFVECVQNNPRITAVEVFDLWNIKPREKLGEVT